MWVGNIYNAKNVIIHQRIRSIIEEMGPCKALIAKKKGLLQINHFRDLITNHSIVFLISDDHTLWTLRAIVNLEICSAAFKSLFAGNKIRE